MKNLREQKGITLVALVITIIVLLILAGVALSLVAGNEGILTKATTAVDETEVGMAVEQTELLAAEAAAAYYEAKYVTKDTTVGTMDEYMTTAMNGKTTTDCYVTVENGAVNVYRGTSASGTPLAQGTLSNGKITWASN